MDNPGPQASQVPWTDIYNLTQEKVNTYIAELKAQGDEESLETAKALEELPSDFFEFSKEQERLRNFLTLVKQAGFTEEALVLFMNNISERIHRMVLDSILQSMAADTRAYWDRLMDENLNVFQVLVLMNFYTTTTFGKSFDEYVDMCTGKVLDGILALIDEERETAESLNRKSPEEIDDITRLLESGDVDQAMIKLYASEP